MTDFRCITWNTSRQIENDKNPDLSAYRRPYLNYYVEIEKDFFSFGSENFGIVGRTDAKAASPL